MNPDSPKQREMRLRRETVRELHAQGLTNQAIAAKLGICHSMVGRIFQTEGIVIDRQDARYQKDHQYQEARRLEMIELRIDGWTLQAIGDHYGLTRERVRQLLKHTKVDGVIQVERQIAIEARVHAKQARILAKLPPDADNPYTRLHLACQVCQHERTVNAHRNPGRCPQCKAGDPRPDAWKGRQFGFWTVIERVDAHFVRVRCQCGLEATRRVSNFYMGTSVSCTSCGIARREKNRAAGLTYQKKEPAL